MLEVEYGIETFISVNDLKSIDVVNRIIPLTYFMFTTLSTVGLGDFHPTNDQERILGTLILLFGVLITTFVNEKLMKMIQQLSWVDHDFEETDKLSLFLTVMKKFNANQNLSRETQEQFDSYFRYRWSHDHCLAISKREDIELLE